MSIDAANRFSKNQAGYNAGTPLLEGELVTAAAFLSGVIDRLSVSDTGAGEAIYPFAQVAYGDGTSGHDFNDGGTNALTSADFVVYGADSLDMGTNAVILSANKTVLRANLTAGSLIPMPPLTPGIKKRYIGIKVTPNGGPASQGAIVAGLVDRTARPQTFVQPGNGTNTGGPTGHSI